MLALAKEVCAGLCVRAARCGAVRVCIFIVCVCGGGVGGGGADRVYMESLCRLYMTHATN